MNSTEVLSTPSSQIGHLGHLGINRSIKAACRLVDTPLMDLKYARLTAAPESWECAIQTVAKELSENLAEMWIAVPILGRTNEP
jgi:hypothetical protein